MTSPNQLRPGRPAPKRISLRPTRTEQDLRPVYDSLADEWGWPAWDDWRVGFARPGRHYALILVGGTPAGLAKSIDHGKGVVQIDNFGLIAPFVGRGFGGESLTRVVESAWELALRDRASGLVWLHTCNWDHPRALQSYQARGFEVVLTEPVATSQARDYALPQADY